MLSDRFPFDRDKKLLKIKPKKWKRKNILVVPNIFYFIISIKNIGI